MPVPVNNRLRTHGIYIINYYNFDFRIPAHFDDQNMLNRGLSSASSNEFIDSGAGNR